MKAMKLVILCTIITVVMIVGWVIGSLIGNGITQSAPPPPPDPAKAGMVFLLVCAFNSVLVALLIRGTSGNAWPGRWIAVFAFVFSIQHLLPQMDTFFFASDIGISYRQATAIVITGAFASLLTVAVAMYVDRKLFKSTDREFPKPSFGKNALLLAGVLIFVVYPFLYLTFGYYVAWQNENLRIYYTGSSYLNTYLDGWGDAFANGLYFFQVLRGLIWVMAIAPVAMMLKDIAIKQYLVVGILCSLLPASLLFIPNPYMPWEVAMAHFVETASSNFVWGLIVVWGIRTSNTQYEHSVSN